MKKLPIALAALPLMAGVAAAGQPQPLNDKQMDKVTAGFSAWGFADAQGLVGESGILTTYTASLSKVTPVARATFFETSSTLYLSISAAQSSSISTTYNPAPVPGTSLPGPDK
jgi:hypothetical protein